MLFFIFFILLVFACVLFRRVLCSFPFKKGLGSFLFHFFVFCVFCGFVASAFRFVSLAVSLPFRLLCLLVGLRCLCVRAASFSLSFCACLSCPPGVLFSCWVACVSHVFCICFRQFSFPRRTLIFTCLSILVAFVSDVRLPV